MKVTQQSQHTRKAKSMLWLFTIALTLVVLISCLHIAYNLPAVYTSQHYGNQTTQYIQQTLAYLNTGTPYPADTLRLMSVQEQIHMEDVYNLFIYVRTLAVLCAVVVLAFGVYFWRNNRRQGKRYVHIAAKRGAITIGACTLIILIFFRPVFIAFHHIAFTNDYWLLPPQSFLIQLFPHHTFFLIAAITLLSSTGILVITAYLTRHHENR